jgi:hypothetical protein
MGTRFAPSLANHFMGHFESKLISNFHLQPKVWLRFIDDIFLIWTHGEKSLLEFIKYANSTHKTIKLTSEHSTESIVFLDTRVKIDPVNRNLYTILYTKPTDTRDFLHFSSAHPKSTKTKGPYGQFLRLRRVCTKDSDFVMESRRLVKDYMRRGYPKHLVEEHLNKAAQFSQNELLEPKEKKESDKQVLVLTYNPGNPNLMQIIRRFWLILQTNRTLGRLFKDEPLIAFRRQKKLKDMLTSAKISYPPEKKVQKDVYQLKHTTCPKITWRYCRILNKKWKIKSSFLNMTFNVRIGCRISCRTPNIVYVITCLKCYAQYVGESKRPIRDRMLRAPQNYGKAIWQSWSTKIASS